MADTSEEQNCEIVDIQFAMSDYQYMEDIVAIKDYANQIATYDAELKSLEEDAQEVSTVSKIAKFVGEAVNVESMTVALGNVKKLTPEEIAKVKGKLLVKKKLGLQRIQDTREKFLSKISD